MLTEKWDSILARKKEYFDKVALLYPRRDHVIGDVYPIITKKWFDITGRFAGHPSVDGWTNEVAHQSGGLAEVARVDEIEIKDTTFCGETKVDSGPDFPVLDLHSPEVQEDLKKDVDKIKRYFNA